MANAPDRLMRSGMIIDALGVFQISTNTVRDVGWSGAASVHGVTLLTLPLSLRLCRSE
jgi:hypothetical protein